MQAHPDDFSLRQQRDDPVFARYEIEEFAVRDRSPHEQIQDKIPGYGELPEAAIEVQGCADPLPSNNHPAPFRYCCGMLHRMPNVVRAQMNVRPPRVAGRCMTVAVRLIRPPKLTEHESAASGIRQPLS